jgi:uncharacterized membrane protein
MQGITVCTHNNAAMADPAPQPAESARSQEKEVARIAAFSDGVFAIAITLLALQLEIPSGSQVDVWAELQQLWPGFLSLVISFAVIGSYWVAHHRLFAVVERYDERLIWLNMLALFFIVLMPFTTSLIGEHGDGDAAVVVYSLSVAAAGFAATLMVLYALGGRRLCRKDLDERVVKYHVWRGLIVALIFSASLLLLPLGPTVVELSWLSIIVARRIVRRRFARPGEA